MILESKRVWQWIKKTGVVLMGRIDAKKLGKLSRLSSDNGKMLLWDGSFETGGGEPDGFMMNDQ